MNRSSKFLSMAAVAAVVVGGYAGNAHAVDAAFTVAMPTGLDASTINLAIAATGGAALLGALTTGAGFRMARKVYGWVLGKIG